jgi:hypothetical protein
MHAKKLKRVGLACLQVGHQHNVSEFRRLRNNQKRLKIDAEQAGSSAQSKTKLTGTTSSIAGSDFLFKLNWKKFDLIHFFEKSTVLPNECPETR